MSKQTKKGVMLLTAAILCLCAGSVFAATSGAVGVAVVASNVISNLSSVAKLITAGAYVAGFGFAVAAILKFKAHKDNPTQVPLGTGIALLFIGAALIFIPSVFRVSGGTLFGTASGISSTSGVATFTPPK